MQKYYIQDTESLCSLCDKLKDSPVLAIDTEFVRTRTLYPKLGLLQIANDEHLALIDPIAIDDLSAFWELLTDANILKVIHACSEDLEVFLTAANCKPVNLIDSQVMMSFLGHGLSLGYAAMVKHFLDIDVDKSESRTDWTKRPLSDKQLTYAQADVEHLISIFPTLKTQVEQAGWFEASVQETELMIARKFTPIDSESLYTNVKMAWKLNPKQLCILRALASWRYQRAKQRDLPLSFIVKDNTLLAVAQNIPHNMPAMTKIEGAEVLDIRHQGKAMLGVINKALEMPAESYPVKIKRLDEYPNYKQIFKSVKTFNTDKLVTFYFSNFLSWMTNTNTIFILYFDNF